MNNRKLRAHEKAKAKAAWWKYNKRQVIVNAGLLLFIVAACVATHVLTRMLMSA
jgi:hypothetical protein